MKEAFRAGAEQMQGKVGELSSKSFVRTLVSVVSACHRAFGFEVEKSDDSRTKAINVTGPDGAHVQGAPRRPSHGSRGGRGGRGGRAKKSAAAKETDDDAKGGTAEAAQETSKGDAPAAPAADAPAA